MKIKSLLITLGLFLLLFLTGCASKTLVLEEDLGLNSVADARQLKSLLKKRNVFGYYTDVIEENAALDSAPKDSQDRSYTTTNVQVAGVDEGDVVKTDGERIYSIYQDSLRIVQIGESGAMELLLNESLAPEVENKDSFFYQSTYYHELYITENYLLVIGQRYLNLNYAYLPNDRKIDVFYFPQTVMSIIALYDLESLKKVKEYEISGSIIGSRLIGNDFYLLSNYNPYYNEDELRPFVKEGEEMTYVDYQDIKYLPDMYYQAFTLITHVDLEPELKLENDVFLGVSYWNQIYVSGNAIYFSTIKYDYSLIGSYRQYGQIISYFFTEDGGVAYGGYGTFEGYIINQFAMDEYEEHLRIVTTEGWGGSAKNRLYVYERKLVDGKYLLEVVGKIESGLGKPGENVKSVRFNGDRATVVTYQQTDPFYTIDLSDPQNPTIIGALEIPGFSVYQHPWTDTLVIGIGYDAVDGRTTGLKFALYDISDPENPREIGTPLIFSYNESYLYGEALYNHKAIMIDKERGQIGLSLSGYFWYNYQSANNYLILGIDENREDPVYVRHTLTHASYIVENNEQYYWSYKYDIERGLRIGNYLYLISGGVITAHNLDGEIATVDEIIF
jgi:inhibitor of cysteine peptidase